MIAPDDDQMELHEQMRTGGADGEFEGPGPDYKRWWHGQLIELRERRDGLPLVSAIVHAGTLSCQPCLLSFTARGQDPVASQQEGCHHILKWLPGGEQRGVSYIPAHGVLLT